MAYCELGVANGNLTNWELDNELKFGEMRDKFSSAAACLN